MEVPKPLWPLEHHGVIFERESADQLVGQCPFCSSHKFYAHPETVQWQCFTGDCGKSGNLYTFLSQIVEHHAETTSVQDRKALSEIRGVPSFVFKRWGMAMDDYGRWLLPVRNLKGTVQDIRTCTPKEVKDKWDCRLWSTRGCNAGLFGAEQLADKTRKRETVYLCEGEWDTMALDWLLRKLKEPGICVGVPGGLTFKPQWAEWLSGRDVWTLYDNDSTGDKGALKVQRMLSGRAHSTFFIRWPESLPEGYDIRDAILKGIEENKLKRAWATIRSLVHAKPRRDHTASDGEESDDEESAKPKKKPKNLPDIGAVIERFEKWANMNDDMKDALKIMLAVVVSVQISGDPLWLFLVGPPGSGKTMLLKSLARSERCVFESSLSPHSLVSGFRADVDPSLIPKLDGRCFVLKDYTEILSMNIAAQEEVFSTLRGAFDGHVVRSFGNGITRQYTSHFSMLAGVTAAIHGNSRATLGERYLKFQMHKGVVDYAAQIYASLSNIGRETSQEEELSEIADLFLMRDFNLSPESLRSMVPDWVKHRLVAIAQLIGLLRAEVERDYHTQEILYRQQGESGTRLANQLMKLAQCLTVVEGKSQVDYDVYRLVERVALDTAIGFHLDVVDALMKAGGETDRDSLSKAADIPMSTLSRNLDDLCVLNVVYKRSERNMHGRGIRFMYKVSRHVARYWRKAKIGKEPVFGAQRRFVWKRATKG